MDRATAKNLTIERHEVESRQFPLKNDFSYTVPKDDIIWKVLWSRDVNVTNPTWHVSVEEKR